MNCSDATKAWICRQCGSFLSAQSAVNFYNRGGRRGVQHNVASIVRCRGCSREAEFNDRKSKVWEDGTGGKWVGGEDTTMVTIPGVLRYLDVELSAMGIKMKFKVDP